MLTDDEIRLKSIELSITYTNNLLHSAIIANRSITTNCKALFEDADMIFDYIKQGIIPEN